MICLSGVDLERPVYLLQQHYAGKLVRSTDLVGQLDDGAFYVLFPQATADRMPAIEERFSRNGLRCEVVSEDVAVG